MTARTPSAEWRETARARHMRCRPGENPEQYFLQKQARSRFSLRYIKNCDINDIKSVAFSNEDLIKVEEVLPGELNEEGEEIALPDWRLTSLASFYLPETLTVTLKNGAVLEIAVTDPPARPKVPVNWITPTVNGIVHTSSAEFANLLTDKCRIDPGESLFWEEGGYDDADSPNERVASIVTDVEGNEFDYRVMEVEKLEPSQSEEMLDADTWDLTLFTCTLGGGSRIAVRCEKIA